MGADVQCSQQAESILQNRAVDLLAAASPTTFLVMNNRISQFFDDEGDILGMSKEESNEFGKKLWNCIDVIVGGFKSKGLSDVEALGIATNFLIMFLNIKGMPFSMIRILANELEENQSRNKHSGDTVLGSLEQKKDRVGARMRSTFYEMLDSAKTLGLGKEKAIELVIFYDKCTANARRFSAKNSELH